MSAHPTCAELAASLRAVHDESGGLLNLDIVSPDNFQELTAAVELNEPGARTLFRQVYKVAAGVHEAPRKSPKLCGSCPRRIRRGDFFTVVIATPACDDPSNAVGLAICSRCSPDLVSTQAAALRGLKRVWPDLWNVLITHETGGRA